MKPINFSLLIILVVSIVFNASGWGFYAHKRINRLAVFTLPPEMIAFYKRHILYITENAIDPDKRRYAVEGEAPKHYIDIDMYGDSALYKIPRFWDDAVTLYTLDTLMSHGTNPWHVNLMKYQLTEAFRKKDPKAILRLSADIGHYIADGNVPLHTTHNYNGQFTNQIGIHGFWESRLPELYSDDYDFFVGKAEYIKNPQLCAWEAITSAHLALDTVLLFERKLTESFSEDKKYSFEERNGQTIKVYSKAFSKAYHKMLDGQVERRMRASIKMVADFWYTSWVDAGQPELNSILKYKFSEQELDEFKKEPEKEKKSKKEIRPEFGFVSPEEEDHYSHIGCCHKTSNHVWYSKK